MAENDGDYCRAKARLPLRQFPKALATTAKAAQEQVPAMTQLRGRPLGAIAGSALTLSDTSENRKAAPPLQCGDKPSFPMMCIGVLFSRLSGAISLLAQGSLGVPTPSAFGSLMSQLVTGAIFFGRSRLWQLPGHCPPPAQPGGGFHGTDHPPHRWSAPVQTFEAKRLVDPLATPPVPHPV